MSHYDVYGRMAEADFFDTIQNGRHLAQKEAEKFIPDDVISKLHFNEQDRFLDVGCGLGLNLNPISKLVGHSTGCDHPKVIEKLRRKYPNISSDFLEGNFLNIDFPQKYTKILAYSVLPSLPDKETVYKFVDKVLSVMEKDGRALLGDIANIDKKKRFLSSKRGQEFQEEWEARSAAQETQHQKKLSSYQEKEDMKAVIIDDAFIIDLMKYIRKSGFDAFILEQPHNLPFGFTREDIIIG